MHLVFLDESGSAYSDYSAYVNGYAKNLTAAGGGVFPPYPFFVVAGLAIQEAHISVVDDWFSGIKARYLRSPGPVSKQAFEIKGSLLYSLRLGKTPVEWSGVGRKRKYTDAQKAIWSVLAQRQLEELERSIFDLLLRIRPTIWVVTIDQHRVFQKFKAKTWPPYFWALTYLQQRVVHHIQAFHGAYGRAMFVMDETSTLSSAAQFDDFIDIRNTINQTASWPADFARYTVDVPLFGKSHLHQALQLVDVIAHTVRRHIRKEDKLDWFSKVTPFLARHWTGGTHDKAGWTFVR